MFHYILKGKCIFLPWYISLDICVYNTVILVKIIILSQTEKCVVAILGWALSMFYTAKYFLKLRHTNIYLAIFILKQQKMCQKGISILCNFLLKDTYLVLKMIRYSTKTKRLIFLKNILPDSLLFKFDLCIFL